MVEVSWPWDGEAVGDAGPYDSADWNDFEEALDNAYPSYEGPIPGYFEELVVNQSGASLVAVGRGGALVRGRRYRNTEARFLDVPIPGGTAIRYDLVVLRKTFAAQVIRVVVLTGTAVAFPSVTQNTVVWEVPLAFVTTQGPGGITEVLDARVFRQPAGAVLLTQRVGGHAADWIVGGDTVYSVKAPFMIVGSKAIHFAIGQRMVIDVLYFPRLFGPWSNGQPIVYLQCTPGDGTLNPADDPPRAVVVSSDTDSFTYGVLRQNPGDVSADQDLNMLWWAVGPNE